MGRRSTSHRHTAAVHLAKAGMPLHLLQNELGHAKIDATMRYARFHPEHGDVGAYFARVGEQLGFHSGKRLDREAARKAAQLLGLDVEVSRAALKDAVPGNEFG